MKDNGMDKPRILIIDDDSRLSKTLADILQIKGYETVAAQNGAEGLTMLGKCVVNIVIIDLVLPDIPGIDLLKKIKTEQPMVEAIILTGNATLDSAIEATNWGAFSFLLKPCDIDQLLLHIQRAIAKQRSYEKTIKQSMESQKINAELRNLDDISGSISKTADMNELFSDLLKSLNMSLAGNLEDLGLGEILQIISLSRKSGILSLHCQGDKGRIVFRQGQVIRATSPTCQEGLGEVLVRKGLIDQGLLGRALSFQKEEGFKERLGTVLIKYFQISAPTIEEVVREQIENVVYSLFDWTKGTFDFEIKDNVEVVDAIEMDPMQFMLDQGLNTQFLVMEGARIIDEKRHRQEGADFAQPLAPEIAPPEESIDLVLNQLEPAPPLSSPPLSAESDEKPVLVIVDDNAAIRDALVQPLEKSEYTVYPFARSGDALLKLAALYRNGWRPMALVDLIMPRMDGTGMLGGVELLELIKDNFPDIPVLAMADYHNTEAEWKIRRMRSPLIMKPRYNEIGNNALLQNFVERLLAGLVQVRSGGGPTEWSEKVNFGDELRPETAKGTPPASGPVIQSTGIALLRKMLEELNNPSLGEGVIPLLLRFASVFMNRAIIFMVDQDEIASLGQLGIGDNESLADSEFNKMIVPMDVNPLFSHVIGSQAPVKKEPDPGSWDRSLFGQLGGGVPTEVFVGPIVSEGEVIALLYGDNLPEKKPIGDTATLEIFLCQAGLAMGKAVQQQKLKLISK